MSELLRRGPFRRLLSGWVVSNFADSVLFLTLAIWAKELTGSSSAAALVFLALGLPVLISPAMGLLADRVSRKRLMVIGNAVAAVLVLALLLVNSAAQVWLIYLVTFGYGALGALGSAAQSGLVRDLVAEDDLARANGLLVTIAQGFRVVTPGLGAGLYVLWGGHVLALAVAGMLALAAVLIGIVDITESAKDPQSEGPWRQITAGLRHLVTVPVLVRMVVTIAAAFAVVGIFESALFEVIDKALHLPASFFGVLMTVQGAGSVLGGLTAAAVLARIGPLRAQGIGLGMVGVAGALMALTGDRSWLLAVVITASLVAGVGIPWMIVALVTTRQRHTPIGLQGRVSAATNVAMNVPQLISITAGAALITVMDYRILLLVAAAVLLGCSASLLWARSPAEPVLAPSTTSDPVSVP